MPAIRLIRRCLDLRRAGHVQDQGRDAPVRGGQGWRVPAYTRLAPRRRLRDERCPMPRLAPSPDCLVCDCHHDGRSPSSSHRVVQVLSGVCAGGHAGVARLASGPDRGLMSSGSPGLRRRRGFSRRRLRRRSRCQGGRDGAGYFVRRIEQNVTGTAATAVSPVYPEPTGTAGERGRRSCPGSAGGEWVACQRWRRQRPDAPADCWDV